MTEGKNVTTEAHLKTRTPFGLLSGTTKSYNEKKNVTVRLFSEVWLVVGVVLARLEGPVGTSSMAPPWSRFPAAQAWLECQHARPLHLTVGSLLGKFNNLGLL